MTGAATTELPGSVPDDDTLVGRARDGDMRAYEQLVVRYQGQMFRLSVKMLADRADAEDVVQDVFLNAWRRLAQLNDDSAFVGWLYRMTTNRCLNVIRARRPRTDVDPDTTESQRTETRPDHAVQVSSQLQALNDALQLLTPEQRACWLLREVHGLSYEEIGDIVEAKTTAVRGRIARARAHLSEVMKPWR
ncbi:RNA polymerase sigma factor [Nocardia callitridis]|uniref:RNA polymerase sigma factor n=1 Tax=Nocardia callitridis TaxID=648753 RepID=A0ABP9KK37_9NOCA